MHLYLMRHGPAEDEAPSGRDRDRALSKEGQEVVRGIVAKWKGDSVEKGGNAPQHILSSPYQRAKETAALVADAFELVIEEDEALALDEDALGVVRRVERERLNHVILVGHEPDLSRLYFNLTGEGATFQRGTIVALSGVRNQANVLRYNLEWRINGT